MQWLMLQQDEPDDYVIATGRQASVREFLETSAKELGCSSKNSKAIIWEGKGLNEIGRRGDTGEIVIRIDSRYFRPCEVDTLLGDSKKARDKLGWSPKISLENLIKSMIKFDLNEAKKELLLIKKGLKSDNK